MKVVQLRPSHVKAFYAKMSRARYANSTIEAIHMLLYPSLELVAGDEIIRKNLARKAMPSDYRKAPEEKEVLTPKTKAGVRVIPFTENVHRAFLEQRKINCMLGRRSTEEIDGYSDFIS